MQYFHNQSKYLYHLLVPLQLHALPPHQLSPNRHEVLNAFLWLLSAWPMLKPKLHSFQLFEKIQHFGYKWQSLSWMIFIFALTRRHDRYCPPNRPNPHLTCS